MAGHYCVAMTESQPMVPAGWYPDPQNSSACRWWDGEQWTYHVRPVPQPTPAASVVDSPLTDDPWPLRSEVRDDTDASTVTRRPAESSQTTSVEDTEDTEDTDGTAIPVRAVPPRRPVVTRAWFWVPVMVVVLATLTGFAWTRGLVPLPLGASPSSAATDEAALEQPSSSSTIDNGDHVVGVDFEAGVYRADVQPNGVFTLCTLSQEDAQGNFLDIRSTTEGSVIFTVADQPGSVVSVVGCRDIGLASTMLRTNPDPITDGYWLVGDELAPGAYTATVDVEASNPLATASQWAADGSLIDIHNLTTGDLTFTVADQPGSVVEFSGFSSILPS